MTKFKGQAIYRNTHPYLCNKIKNISSHIKEQKIHKLQKSASAGFKILEYLP